MVENATKCSHNINPKHQGDLMSLLKNHPKCSPTNLSKLTHNLNHGKSSQKCGLHRGFKKNLPKVNNRPLGENSPNLVTLPGTGGRCYDHNFLRFFPIFGEKIGVFLENQCYDLFFKF
jgi:hypothetical protein